MKKIKITGFTNTETATSYFQEKEAILEGIVKTLETITVQETGEVEALKSTVKALREEIKGYAKSPRELTFRELLYNLGKGISAPVLATTRRLRNWRSRLTRNLKTGLTPVMCHGAKRAERSVRHLEAVRFLAILLAAWQPTNSI
jgi:hypothetical protein